MEKVVQILSLKENGKPQEVIELNTITLPQPRTNQVLVKQLAASINPADLLMIQGRYANIPSLPIIPGYDGVGVIEQIGPAVQNLKIGDHVISPRRLGAWCEGYITTETELIAVPKEIPNEQAALLSVNPPTAWRMLHDFVELKKGDWIIQNAANSMVGRSVISFAKAKGWKTINIVRRPELINELLKIGGDIVILGEPEEYKKLEVKPKLGLNAVGGSSARNIANTLDYQGHLITYGALSGEPVQIDNGSLIYNNIQVQGFWRTAWMKQAKREQIINMYLEIFDTIQKKPLKLPIDTTYTLQQFKDAFIHIQKKNKKGKILFLVPS